MPIGLQGIDLAEYWSVRVAFTDKGLQPAREELPRNEAVDHRRLQIGMAE